MKPENKTLADKRTVHRRLRSAWRRERLFVHGRGACYLGIWFVALTFVFLLVDWLLDLPGYARWALAAVCLTLLGATFVRKWWRHLRRYDSTKIALRVEGKHPELQSILISHVQLEEDASRAGGTSPSLLRALHERASRIVAPLRFSEIVSFRQLRGVAILAGLAVIAFGVSMVVAGRFYEVLVTRLLDPTSRAAYPTKTRIVMISGNVTVRLGDTVQLKAEAEGELPPEGRVEVRALEAGGTLSAWESLPMARQETDATTYFYEQEKSSKSFLYRVRLGDARSEIYRVSVIPPPRLIETRVLVDYPAYTRRTTKEFETLGFEVLEGSRVHWDLLHDCALASAELLLEDSPSIPGKLDPNDPRRVRFERVADRSFSYRFRWTEKDNRFLYEGAVHSTVRVVPDRPPRVRLLNPAGDVKGTLQKELRLTFQTSDDYGCAEAWVVYALGDAPEARMALGELDIGANGTVTRSWKPREALPELQEGDLLSYAVEVRDQRTGEKGPNRGRSRSLELEIVSIEDYFRYIEEKKSELFSNVRGVLDEESRSSRTVHTLKESTP